MNAADPIRERAARVLDAVARAAQRSGRRVEEVRLVAAGKSQPAESIGELLEAGITAFGENYVQEAERKILAYPRAEWHLIGKLQRNKVKKAVSLFAWIQTVDSLALLAEISRRAGEAGKVLPVLVEVNLEGEGTKAGVSPGSFPRWSTRRRGFPASPEGADDDPPVDSDPEESRPYFARLRELLRVRLPGRGGGWMTELSMGMSNDYEAAIEEGATMVRVGTAIFGSRAGGGA